MPKVIQMTGKPLLRRMQVVETKVKEWVESISERASQWDDCWGHFRVEEVPGESYDGFIAFTNGGWEGIVYADMRAAYGSGSIPKAIQPYIDSTIKEAEQAFEEKHGVSVEDIYKFGDDPDQIPLIEGVRETEHPLRETWSEFEDEWMSEGGTYFYKVRALYYHPDNHRNETGEDEIIFCVGINTDFEYGRDSIPWLSCYGGNPQQTQWLWEKTVKVSEITSDLLKQMEEEAFAALGDA